MVAGRGAGWTNNIGLHVSPNPIVKHFSDESLYLTLQAGSFDLVRHGILTNETNEDIVHILM